MGMPDITISFTQLGKSASNRSQRGVIALVLKDTKHSIFIAQGEEDIPEDLNAANKKLLKLAFIGNVSTPNKIIVYVLGSDSNLDDALNYFESQEFTLFCYPGAETADKTKVKAFINKMNTVVKYQTDALMFKEVANNEAIINLTATGVDFNYEAALSSDVMARIAGLIEGTPLHQATTFSVLPDVTKVEVITTEQADARVDAGELILVREMGKVRIGRGVNSLTDNKGESFKKIKLRKIMNLIHNDIRRVIVEKYIGKIPNSYDNKCVLITEINNYLNELAKEQLIQADYTVNIDLEAHRKYLIDNTNLDVPNMNEQQIKEANTGSNVFLSVTVKLLDSIEDVKIRIDL